MWACLVPPGLEPLSGRIAASYATVGVWTNMDQTRPACGGSGAPPRGPWLARETPAGCPRQAGPAWAIALLGGALAGSGPGTSPCIDGLSLVTGMVVPSTLRVQTTL